jgi:hypothetical protein
VTSLRRLAEGTDGTAVVATNDIAPALRRIADDLSSYYLLGYSSTGRFDGRFHAITVRVKRPGVSVRARRGYQAPRAADLTKAALPPPTSAAASADIAITAAALSAIANMTGSVRDLPLRVHITAGWRTGAAGRPVAAFWAVGEVVGRLPGSDLEAVLTTGSGEILAIGRGRIVPGTTSALVAVVPSQSVEPGDYVVRVRSQSPIGTETLSLPVRLPPASQSSGAVFIHRGPPSAADAAGARLLDRTGKPLAVPVVAATRTDTDGTRWATGELALAPLGAGDYVIEVSAGATRTLVAFRVVL